MKKQFPLLVRFCALTVFLLITLITSTNFVFAQKKSKSSVKKTSCQIGDISFVCPKGFKPALTDSEQNYVLLLHPKEPYSLFVAILKQSSSENDVINQVLKTSLIKLFPKESQNFRYSSFDLSDSLVAKISVNQISGGAMKGFNGNLVVLEKHFRLKVKDNEYVVGYVAEHDRGETARDSFEGVGGESISGCLDLTQIIYSLTGEKVPAKQNPCNVEVTQPLNE